MAKQVVNIKRLIKLLGDRLFRDPKIVLKELISNANDACIIAMTVNEQFLENVTNYRIEIFHESPNKLIIKDNGIGMTKEDLEDHLSTIANDNKRNKKIKLREEGMSDYATRIIGEFGIGFLSSFIISKEVIVETVPVTSENLEGWRWSSKGDSDYTIEAFKGTSFGTRVEMHIDTKRYSQFNAPLFVKDQLRKVGRYFSVPIYYLMGTEKELVNSDKAPWDLKSEDAIADWRKYLSSIENFKDAQDWLSAFLINEDNIQGILYFPFYNSKQHLVGTVDIYSQGILVEQNSSDIIPYPFKCVRGVIQSSSLKIGLDRESIRHDNAFKIIQERLRDLIMSHIIELANSSQKSKNEELLNIMTIHEEVLKEGLLLIEDNDAFCQIMELVSFYTSQSNSSTILQYLDRAEKYRSIYFSIKNLGNRQLTALVKKFKREIIFIRHPAEVSLLKKYSKIKNLQFIDINEELDLLFDVVEPIGGWRKIIEYYGKLVVHRGLSFQPKLAHNPNSEMPLSLIKRNKGDAPNSHSGNGSLQMDEINFTLYVNKNNTLLQRLVKQVEDNIVDNDHLDLILHELFHHAAIYADENIEQVHLFQHHESVLSEFANLSEEITRKRQTKLDNRLKEKAESTFEKQKDIGNGTVFIGIPFKEPYLEVLYGSLKSILIDLKLEPIIMKESLEPGQPIPIKIYNKIQEASAAIFDVSEENLNIYYELGIAHGLKKDRTFIICNTNKLNSGSLPIDTSSYTTIDYPHDFSYKKFTEFLKKLSDAISQTLNNI